MTSPGGLKIVVEGPTDVQIVRAILGEDLAKKARFFAARGLLSLAIVLTGMILATSSTQNSSLRGQ
jgi:hypothetical protein